MHIPQVKDLFNRELFNSTFVVVNIGSHKVYNYQPADVFDETEELNLNFTQF